ncbi:uncharacterized protein BO96DRAFT_232043 [Aspergillus niger CBS 101883]|uniref:Secreted protein n=1 Tax=Aspergillus niger ATCC 13496 TaxID=1353008 RepID=A0A370BY30_ASPNG|nr:uncharacterized protein BO96DRAFT_232043 [Aspergillus niger CBS 101883]PYH59038.1 hypothetical protein BO96DRAFT_232043 [Aspergillus niger CBS 101883]RDH18332.1 hypothetical protein M747DRAFT_75101 [Aspergillus niger ATCC 13496]
MCAIQSMLLMSCTPLVYACLDNGPTLSRNNCMSQANGHGAGWIDGSLVDVAVEASALSPEATPHPGSGVKYHTERDEINYRRGSSFPISS